MQLKVGTCAHLEMMQDITSMDVCVPSNGTALN